MDAAIKPQTNPIALPNFSKEDIQSLKKYFEYNEKHYDEINQQLMREIKDHPLWGPMLKQMSPEMMKAQNERSRALQRAAVYEGKWREYASDLISQGRTYAQMNISYTDWYELIGLAKVLIMPRIKRDFKDSVDDAIDIIDGLSKFVDYAMYGIAEAYFQEKNAIINEGKERFRIIFESSGDVISLIGTKGEILALNHASDRNAEDFVGKSVFDIQSKENSAAMRLAMKFAFERKEPTNFESTIIEGENKKYFSSTISPVINSNDSVEQAVIVSRDITRQKQAEHELKKMNQTLEQKVAERTQELSSINKELESFTYSVSHDLRAPLRAINGFSGILKEDSFDVLTDDAKDALNEIVINVKRMGQLIDNLLEFSRLGKQNMSKAIIDMGSLVSSVIGDVRKTMPEKTQINPGTLKDVRGDMAMIKQVLINLVSNAIKYSSKKEHPVIEIGSKEEENNVVYYVRDNGAGFNMAYYDKLFGVFQRLHGVGEFEGTGVGLAIVQRIILKHSGKVWAEGKENEGATFYFSLPK